MEDMTEIFLKVLIRDISHHPDDYKGLSPRTILFRVKEFVSDSGYMDINDFDDEDEVLKQVRYYILGEEID